MIYRVRSSVYAATALGNTLLTDDGILVAKLVLYQSLSGKLCIEVTPADKIAVLSEDLCIGCGICSHVSFITNGMVKWREVLGPLSLQNQDLVRGNQRMVGAAPSSSRINSVPTVKTSLSF